MSLQENFFQSCQWKLSRTYIWTLFLCYIAASLKYLTNSYYWTWSNFKLIHKYKPLSQHFFCLGWIESVNVNVPPQGWISSSNSLSVVYIDVAGLQLFDIHSCHPNQRVTQIVSTSQRYFLFRKQMWNKNALVFKKLKDRKLSS